MSSIESQSSIAGNLHRLLAGGYMALLLVTPLLWTPQNRFPRVPLLSCFIPLPHSIEWGLLILLLTSLAGILFAKKLTLQRLCRLIVGLATIGLVGFDQHRLQPWAWQFLILSLVLAMADATKAMELWRWLVIGIYAWSAWSKIDYGFCLQHGPYLLEGLVTSLGLRTWSQTWSPSTWAIAAATIPIFELAVAVLLIAKRTRRMGLVGSLIMHVGLLLTLGPLGHNHRPGVLVWNLFFILQNCILFRRTPVTQQQEGPELHSVRKVVGNDLATGVLVFVLAWPILESIGLCDHWPAWAVYAAKPERVTFYVAADELTKLPPEWKSYFESSRGFDDWCSVRLDRWSLDTLSVPIYPQERFHVGVALAVIRDFDLQQIRLTIDGPANRLTGRRVAREFSGRVALQSLANSFRLNASPRY